MGTVEAFDDLEAVERRIAALTREREDYLARVALISAEIEWLEQGKELFADRATSGLND